MRLYVQLEDGEFKEFTARSSDSMLAVRSKISEEFGLAASQQKLWFQGKELADAPTLAHSLWDALKKVQGAADPTGNRLELSKVKQLCSPSSTPKRGLSKSTSYEKMPVLAEDPVLSTEDVLTGAAMRLEGKIRPDSPTGGVSPQRRTAAMRLRQQYSDQMEG
mmetsp:Transcript_32495/g.50598  ORF Transcript_32495/g.50598 Transcript_32495/m.50598 type:complete len:163 (+) Transcript_32495:595-1083(+)|eukprot:CAMPEP_0184326110 /NCGR_PEP_ID=MMETSP1049-20130417/142387_1 /TAXON_ID=77928 /ORGANISM="Proteomonas sulcata, Strain CCMP704" /LENGTH=162 /DNA_ID=CAMNT_0026648281 /DNA_START=620 /DNA_END=1108 /DNA_ORIENTATION=+